MSEDLFAKRYGWYLKAGLVGYDRALKWQKGLVKMRLEGLARDTIILLEHPPVITVGRSGHDENFSNCKLEPVFVERGGDVTYHGPGQLVAYFVFDLTRRGRDLHRFMADLQQGIIDTFADYGIQCRKDDEHTGVWTDDKKIASVGIAVKKWVTFHGIAVNLNTDLKQFEEINPCGLQADLMTSAKARLGRKLNLDEFGLKLIEHYGRIFVTRYEPVQLEELAEELESQAGGYTL